MLSIEHVSKTFNPGTVNEKRRSRMCRCISSAGISSR